MFRLVFFFLFIFIISCMPEGKINIDGILNKSENTTTSSSNNSSGTCDIKDPDFSITGLSKTIRLSWNKENNMEYTLYRSDDGGNTYKVINNFFGDSTGTIVYDDSEGADNDIYCGYCCYKYYRLKIDNGVCTSFNNVVYGLTSDICVMDVEPNLFSSLFGIKRGKNGFLYVFGIGGFAKLSPDGSSILWEKDFAGEIVIRGMVFDGKGNIYLTGSFRTSTAPMDFGEPFGASDPKTSNGGYDIFITKINSDESYGWTEAIGGALDDFGFSIAIDSNGNVYITGAFSDTVDFGAPFGTTDSRTSAGGRDIFLLKINSNGSYGWVKTFGSSLDDNGLSIVIDSNDNKYIGGNFQDTIDFGAPFGTTDSKTSAGGQDAFLLKVNSDDSYGWIKTFGGASNDSITTMYIDSNGSKYIGGYFQDTIDFGAPFGATDSKTSAGNSDIFFMKLGFNDAYFWTKRIGGGYIERIGINGIYVDGSGNMYIAGSFYSTSVDFAADFGGSDIKNSAGASDAFVTKINSDLTYGFTKIFGDTDYDYGHGVLVDDVYKYLYIVGRIVNPSGGYVNYVADFDNTNTLSFQYSYGALVKMFQY